MRSVLDHSASAGRRSAVKLPALTAGFWLAKLLTTGTGEALSDFLAKEAPWALALALVGLAIALIRQFRAPDYRPVTYWTAVALVAVVGTVVADAVRFLGFSYPVVAGACAVAFAAVLLVWRRVEGSLSIHQIRTRRGEAFYWLAVMASFALGTAAGDLTAFYLGWGFGVSIAVFAVGMVLPWVLYRAGRLGEVAAFWLAYAMTRPLGATLADWLGKPAGLDLGDGPVALVGLLGTAAVVAYLALRPAAVTLPVHNGTLAVAYAEQPVAPPREV